MPTYTRGTSSKCSNCGHTEKSDRIERGSWKCSSCGIVMHEDINGADNIQQKAITVTSPLTKRCGGSANIGDIGNGCVALPRVYYFDRTSGFVPRDCEVDCKPETSNPVSSTHSSSEGESNSLIDSCNMVAGETGSPSLQLR